MDARKMKKYILFAALDLLERQVDTDEAIAINLDLDIDPYKGLTPAMRARYRNTLRAMYLDAESKI